MKVAVISDIHGNNFALEEVLKECTRENVQRILVLGDIVGYYYHPEIILDMLSKWDCDMIKGNHETILENLFKKRIDSENVKKKYGSGHEKALSNLDEKDLLFLLDLPVQKDVVVDGVTFQLNHGTPWNQDEYLYPDAPTKTLLKCNSKKHDFVLIGHSHYAFSYECSDSVLINSGSVGQSRQKGGIANWTLIDTKNKRYKIMSTRYDVSKLLSEIKCYDPDNSYIAKILTR